MDMEIEESKVMPSKSAYDQLQASSRTDDSGGSSSTIGLTGSGDKN